MAANDNLSNLKTVSTSITHSVSSPYPPSAELEGYEHVLPGAAERIFKLVESETKHRQELEKLALQKESRDSLLGIVFAFIIAMATTIGGGVLAYYGQSIAGSILGVSGVASIVGAFLRSRPRNQHN